MWAASLLAMALTLTEATGSTLNCSVDGSDDHFILYPWQRKQVSDSHWIYSLMGGLTIAVVDRTTLRFNRLTSLNLQRRAQPLQLFTGQCVLVPDSISLRPNTTNA